MYWRSLRRSQARVKQLKDRIGKALLTTYKELVSALDVIFLGMEIAYLMQSVTNSDCSKLQERDIWTFDTWL